MKKLARLFMPVLGIIPVSWDNLFNDVVDYMYPMQDQQELSEYVTDNLYNDLYEIFQNPINVNSTCKEQLEILPFLSYSNIEELEAYVYFNRGMLSLGELQLIEGYTNTLANLLQPFLYIGPYMDERELTNERSFQQCNSILADLNWPMYRKSDINYSTSLRYAFNNHKKIKFGITTQSDFGERLYDYISTYFVYSGNGLLQNVLAGNLRVSFGQGLVANQGFSVYNSVSVQTRQSDYGGIKPHTGVSEYGYLSGIGTVFNFGSFKVSAVSSYTAVDATLNKDGFVSSFKEDGYHRTNLEKSKHHNTRQLTALLHVEHFKEGINMGGTCSYTQYDRPLLGKVFKTSQYALDSGLLDFGADFLVNRSRYSIAAELAASCIACKELFGKVNLAAFFSGGLNVGGNGSLRLMARYYSPGYYSPFSGAYSKGSCNNEQGLYLSYCLKRKIFGMNVYQDFCLLKNELCLEAGAQFDLNRDHSLFSVRLKSKSKFKQYQTYRLRFDWKYRFNKLLFQTSFNYCAYMQNMDLGIESGYALQERISYTACPFAFDFSGALFFTGSYNTRISMYEKGLLYSYGYSSFYGRGLRLSVSGNVSLDALLSGLVLRFKASSTIYFDRSEITSQSYYDIGTFHKEDLSIQLQYKF